MSAGFTYPAADSSAPAMNFFDVTPNDTDPLSHNTRGVYVGTSGDLKAEGIQGGTVIFKNLAAGMIHPIAAKRIYAAGTTATDIVGVY